MDINSITEEIIGAAICIHKGLGPGLLESVYEELLQYQLAKRGFHVQRQILIPVVYEQVRIDAGFRADLIVESQVIVEVKSTRDLAPVHEKQLLTYLRLTDMRIGLLINFNSARLLDGLKRIANKY